MSKDKFEEAFRRDLLKVLTDNEGEGLRYLIRYAKKSKDKKVKRDMETILSHPAIKPLIPH